MLGVNNASTTLHQKLYSPLTLNSEWSRTWRLVFVLFCIIFGSTLNGFFVASFFVQRTLKKIGNIYLACAGFADLLITTLAMVPSGVILLSGQWDNAWVCRVVQFTTELATYAYNFFFLMVAAENFCRVCRTTAEYRSFLSSLRVDLVSAFIYVLSLFLAAVGVSLDLDYDCCERKFYGHITFRYYTSIFCFGIPMTLTLTLLSVTMSTVKNCSRHYRRYRLYRRNNYYSTTASNITAYVLFVVAWIPYVVIVNGFPRASDGLYYITLWIGLLRSVFSGFIYGITNRCFRRTYVDLYNYCFCKRPLPGSFANRRRRALEYNSSTGDVQLHIFLNQAVMSSPYHGASTSRETRV